MLWLSYGRCRGGRFNLVNTFHCVARRGLRKGGQVYRPARLQSLQSWEVRFGKTFRHVLMDILYIIIYSRPPPPNTADLGTDEKAAVFGNRRYWESYITYKTRIWDLEMGSGIGLGGSGIGLGGGGIGGRRYWEGGAVL